MRTALDTGGVGQVVSGARAGSRRGLQVLLSYRNDDEVPKFPALYSICLGKCRPLTVRYKHDLRLLGSFACVNLAKMGQSPVHA